MLRDPLRVRDFRSFPDNTGMTVDLTRLPTLKLGSRGSAVKAAKMGVNQWNAKKANTTPVYGLFFRRL